MNYCYDILKEEAAVLYASSEKITEICRSVSSEGDLSAMLERMLYNAGRIEKLSEMIAGYASEAEEAEEDILAFMRSRLSVNDHESMVSDVIIEKSVPYVQGSVFSNRTLTHSDEINKIMLRKITEECGEKN